MKVFRIKLLTLILVLGLIPFANCKKKNASSGWEKTFGGTSYDKANAIQQTSDGGYIIAGVTLSFGAGYYDVYLIKTSANGNQQWYKTFGGVSHDEGYSVLLASDGSFIIAGSTSSFGDGGDVYLIKTDASGNQQWYKTFGGSSDDEGYSVQPTTDSGYIIAGVTWSFGAGKSDVYLVKVDADGNQQWYKTFGGIDCDYGSSVQLISDGGYIITGTTESFGAGKWDIFLIKTDANGNQQWYKTFGGTDLDYGSSVQLTSDGGYIIAGYTYSLGIGKADIYLIKVDMNGNQQWYKTFGGTSDDRGYSFQQTLDGGYIIAGYTGSFPNCDVYLIKTDASGNEQWSKTFGGSNSDAGYSVQQTTDGGYIITGYTESFGAGYWDVYLVKTDANGNVE